MLFPLDIIFINSTEGVVGVMHNVQPGATDVRLENNTLPGARCFLEVNAGEAGGIEVGDSVNIQGYTQQAQFDISTLLNFALIVVVLVMMTKMVSRALEPAEELPALLGTTKLEFLSEAKLGGTCYADAWRFLIKEGEGELIHGTVQTIGKRINHAWVETETGYIWEPEHRGFMKKDYFYQRVNPKIEARYNAEEATIMAARTKNFGPWTEEERSKFLKEKTPALIPTEPKPRRKTDLEYLADSPEFLTQTIENIGYRDKLDTTFQEAIARAKGLR